MQPSPHPTPSPNASAAELIAWGLGDAPKGAAGPPWSPGGESLLIVLATTVYMTPARAGNYDSIVYMDKLMLHDDWAGPTASSITRINANLGQYIWGNIYFRTDMMQRQVKS
jgi:hypothetical protein